MNQLQDKLKRIIELSGPISLAEYMHICMADPKHGYYQNKKAIGLEGDFVTSPEISQIFGEMLGIWCIDIWQKIGSPSNFNLVELGPGKGTLMSDLLRTAKIVPEFLKATNITLVETSPIMRAAQENSLAGFEISWLDDVNNLSALPTIYISNEFLDVLPIHQYIKSISQEGITKWEERGIAVNKQSALENVRLSRAIDVDALPSNHEQEPDGAVFENSPSREAIVQIICEQIAENGGAAMFIDYGHAISGFGDTFQAMRAHGFVDALEAPGQADLTSHVDFEPLAKIATKNALQSRITTQSDFLLAMGLLERAGALGQNLEPKEQEKISNAIERLASPQEMGTLFKVLSITDINTHPSGFE